MSTVAWLALAGVALALWLGARAQRYARLFADEHWREVARGLVDIKAAALARPIAEEGEEPRSPDDPRVLTTSAGLAIVYTVSERAGGFVHHWSVGASGGPTPRALGSAFTLYVARLLGVPFADVRCEVAESTVHHAEVTLDAGQHAALAAAPVLDVSNGLAGLRREVLQARASVAWHPVGGLRRSA